MSDQNIKPIKPTAQLTTRLVNQLLFHKWLKLNWFNYFRERLYEAEDIEELDLKQYSSDVNYFHPLHLLVPSLFTWHSVRNWIYLPQFDCCNCEDTISGMPVVLLSPLCEPLSWVLLLLSPLPPLEFTSSWVLLLSLLLLSPTFPSRLYLLNPVVLFLVLPFLPRSRHPPFSSCQQHLRRRGSHDRGLGP